MEEEAILQTMGGIKNPVDAKNVFGGFRGLPFRKYQEEAVRFIVESRKRFVVVEAPTGSGKSLIAMVAGAMVGGMTYMVHTKLLQNQITETFPEAVSLFGRANYRCMREEGRTCDECVHHAQAPCEYKGTCWYEVAKKRLLRSKLRVLNYDYFLSESNYIGKTSGSSFNVIDEADNLENTLINFTTLTFTVENLRMLRLGSPSRKTAESRDGIEPWLSFADMAEISAVRELGKVKGLLRNMDPDELMFLQLTKKARRLVRMMEQIRIFKDNVDETWLMQEDEKGTTFRPLWMNEGMAENFLWRHGAQKWVLMSASFLPVGLISKTLGIPFGEIDYMRVPSTFDPERRKIYIESTGNLTNKTMDTEVPKIVDRVGEILDEHPNEKGIIHAVSYKLANTIHDSVKSPRLIVHSSGTRQEKINEFVASKGNLVLISPSLERGVSLDDDLCRFIIIAKMPFLYLGDKIVSRRVYGSKAGNLWYAATALLTVLQMSGRGMRSEKDWCSTYILDEQFERVLNKYPQILPVWWRDGIVMG